MSCMDRNYFPFLRLIYTLRVCPHIIIATPTAPPTTANISLPKPTVLGAKPVCNPALAAAVPLASPTPAVPLGTESSTSVGATTATDVTVDLLPSGRVVVRREVVVCGCGLRVVVASLEPDPLPLGDMVREPPPTVATIVTPCALMVVTTSPSLRVLVTRSPWALVDVITPPAVSGPVPAAGVVAAPGLEASSVGLEASSVGLEASSVGLGASSVGLEASSAEVAPGARGEVLVGTTVAGSSEITGDSVVRLPSGRVLTAVVVAIVATGVTTVVADAELGTSGVLLLSGTIGSADVVVVPLLGVCRLANATMLLAIDASSLCKASAAVLSFSNMPWVNFFGE